MRHHDAEYGSLRAGGPDDPVDDPASIDGDATIDATIPWCQSTQRTLALRATPAILPQKDKAAGTAPHITAHDVCDDRKMKG